MFQELFCFKTRKILRDPERAKRNRFTRLIGPEPHRYRNPWRSPMRRHFSRGAIVALIVLLAVMAGRSCLGTLLFAVTSPRSIAGRSDLGEAEPATIGLFERVSPSVVQVVGSVNDSAPGYAESEGGREQSGTGFVWDAPAMWSRTIMW